MKKSIWKYPFVVGDEVLIRIPRDARLLDVQMQDGTPCLWALVDTEARTEVRSFRIFGTGHPFDAVDGSYVGTFQQVNGQLVWHLFEVTQ